MDSLKDLVRSLAQPPVREGLKLADEALDEKTLKALSADPEVASRARGRHQLLRLWEVCQTPDFRKTGMEDHLRLVRTLFDQLTGRGGRVPDDWTAEQFAMLETGGDDIDRLAQRLSGVRTLAYLAARPDWLRDPEHWRGRTRTLEDRLSDVLHERLMQRFIDRRTSVLLRSLRDADQVLAGVAGDGSVTVEGVYVGRLDGVRFQRAEGASPLEEKALRAATERAVGPEVKRRLGRLAAEPDDAFALTPEGGILWRGALVGRLSGGRPFSPRVRLFGGLGASAAEERAQRRLEAFAAAEAERTLAPLAGLEAAIRGGALKGLARGVAYRLAEAGGVLARRDAVAELRALSQAERRALRALGVRFGAHSLHLPALLTPEARAALAPYAALEAPHWSPPPGLSRLPPVRPSARALAARGLVACGPFAVPAAELETLDALIRAAPQEKGGVRLAPEALAPLGWSEADLGAVLRAVGYAPARKPVEGEAPLWRRRSEAPAAAPAPPAHSPFAALQALKDQPAPKRRRRPRRRKAAAG